MKSLSIVYPFYRNCGMLAIHYDTWMRYSDELKSLIEIIVVDDGSPKERAHEVPRPEGLPRLRIFRILVDRPWHQHGARNLGAHVAENHWLLMTDMDHLISQDNLDRLIRYNNHKVIYTFNRVDAPDLTPTLREDGTQRLHPNSFAMTRDLFWEIGGYDEDFCGLYGTDQFFRNRAFAIARNQYLPDVSLIRYTRLLVHDASTRNLSRKEGRDKEDKRRVLRTKQLQGRSDSITVLDFPWEQVV